MRALVAGEERANIRPYHTCRENQNTQIVFITNFTENRVVNEKILEKYCKAGQATDDYTIKRMRFAC
jgi:hypothetical protein